MPTTFSGTITYGSGYTLTSGIITETTVTTFTYDAANQLLSNASTVQTGVPHVISNVHTGYNYDAYNNVIYENVSSTGGDVVETTTTYYTPSDIRAWITDAKGMTAKTKATRKPEMKAYNLPKEDVDALVAYLSILKKK